MLPISFKIFESSFDVDWMLGLHQQSWILCHACNLQQVKTLHNLNWLVIQNIIQQLLVCTALYYSQCPWWSCAYHHKGQDCQTATFH